MSKEAKSKIEMHSRINIRDGTRVATHVETEAKAAGKKFVSINSIDSAELKGKIRSK